MFKYIRFALRFIITYYFHKTYHYFGSLPYYKTLGIGTVASVLSGGEFKIHEKYVLTAVGWIKFESNEELVVNSEAYKKQQQEIRKELRRLNLEDNNFDIKV
jgi:hypothetical protein